MAKKKKEALTEVLTKNKNVIMAIVVVVILIIVSAVIRTPAADTTDDIIVVEPESEVEVAPEEPEPEPESGPTTDYSYETMTKDRVKVLDSACPDMEAGTTGTLEQQKELFDSCAEVCVDAGFERFPGNKYCDTNKELICYCE